MIVATNPGVRLTPDQLSYLPWIKTYPGMHLLCLSMRFGKSLIEAMVFGMAPGSQAFLTFRVFAELV